MHVYLNSWKIEYRPNMLMTRWSSSLGHFHYIMRFNLFSHFVSWSSLLRSLFCRSHNKKSNHNHQSNNQSRSPPFISNPSHHIFQNQNLTKPLLKLKLKTKKRKHTKELAGMNPWVEADWLISTVREISTQKVLIKYYSVGLIWLEMERYAGVHFL